MGDVHTFVADSQRNLSKLLVEIGEYEAALPRLEEALAIYLRTRSPRHWTTLNVLFGLGEALTGLGRYEEAEGYLLEAWRGLEESEYFEEAKRPAAELVVGLYDGWGRPEAAAAYRAHLEP